MSNSEIPIINLNRMCGSIIQDGYTETGNNQINKIENSLGSINYNHASEEEHIEDTRNNPPIPPLLSTSAQAYTGKSSDDAEENGSDSESNLPAITNSNQPIQVYTY